MLVRASGQPPGGWGTSSGESGRLTAPGTGWGRRDLPARGRGDTAKGPRSAPRPGPGPAGPGGQRARHPGAAAAPGREPGVGGGGGQRELGGSGQEQPPRAALRAAAAPRAGGKMLGRASVALGSGPGEPGAGGFSLREGARGPSRSHGAGGAAPRRRWGITSPPTAPGIRPAKRQGQRGCRVSWGLEHN